MRKLVPVLLLSLLATPAAAQQINLQSTLERLAAKTANKTEVNLDASMLKLASQFLSDGDKDEAGAKKLVESLKGVYVRVFEFDKPGAYAPGDLDPLRGQLKGRWGQIVSMHEKDETVEVWMHQEGDNTTGMMVISMEPQEVTVVNLVGMIRPADLAALSGQFGIPTIETKKD
jgi:uncharacterized protein DUF4252